MHKYLITALLALVFAVPGMAKETPMSSNSEAVFAMQASAHNPEMDPQLVEAILRAAANEWNCDYTELNNLYVSGVATIEKVSEGYRVSDGGGLVTVLMDDSI